VTNRVEDAFVDVIIEDGYLAGPEILFRSLREPAGRAPSDRSKRVAHALSKLGEEEALLVVRSVLDAATLSIISLFDHDFKNSGLHARLSFGSQVADTRDNPTFGRAYRSRVEPHGVLSESRHLQ
jgi:hypothetical protein